MERRRTLALLAQAQKHPALLPGSAQFDGAMLCARGLLDEFMERARSTQLPLLDREPASPVPTGALVSALRGSHLDAVLFHLCCRGLRKGCRALQVNALRGPRHASLRDALFDSSCSCSRNIRDHAGETESRRSGARPGLEPSCFSCLSLYVINYPARFRRTCLYASRRKILLRMLFQAIDWGG